jgi:peptidoglycan/xylan/chitin deacetylase (PgdA/CDA1 family)
LSGLLGAVSADVDTLACLYKGRGCRRAGGYSYSDLHQGLETMARFFEPYRVPLTLFMVGRDFDPESNHGVIRAMAAAGHELANHSTTHAQGFRLLSEAEQRVEIAGMEAACLRVTGRRPVGFRAPGWNIGDRVLPILIQFGYEYDSSVFPTILMPVMKTAHWYVTRGCPRIERTTMGQWSYMTAPTLPYRTGTTGFGRTGHGGLVELPVTVVPWARLPFFATFLVATGLELFRRSYRWLRARRQPIQFQFHLSDFVDYSHPNLADEVPHDGEGFYVARALRVPLARKLQLYSAAMDLIAADYSFSTLAEWARRVPPSTAMGTGSCAGDIPADS